MESGRALYAGLSKFPLKMLKRAVRMLAERGVRCLVYQPPYSILNRWPEQAGILDWLADNHFTFLGYREYRLERGPSADRLVPVAKSGLGLLRTGASRPPCDW